LPAAFDRALEDRSTLRVHLLENVTDSTEERHQRCPADAKVHWVDGDIGVLQRDPAIC
jgi:hypothetical protein